MKKTGDALMNTKSNVEKSAVSAACDAKKAAIDGFDKECANAEKGVESAVQEVSWSSSNPQCCFIFCLQLNYIF